MNWKMIVYNKKIALAACVCAVCVSSFSGVYAQEMYLSVSGKNAQILSGDSRNTYDIWIRPESNATMGSVQIFDAGLGGAVDFITQDGANTPTTFQLFGFDELYSFNGKTVVPRNTSPIPSSTLTATAEERFKTRWVSLGDTPLQANGNGYIVRVSAGDGNDVNGYNVRVSNSAGMVLSGSSWKIIAIDLSVALFRSSADKAFQIRPYGNQISSSTPLLVAGEEDSKVQKIDLFGEIFPLNGSGPFESEKYGIENNWGLMLTGSKDWLNTLTVYGANEPVLWEFSPIAINRIAKPEAVVRNTPGKVCMDVDFDISSSAISLGNLSQAKWIAGNRIIGEGTSITATFQNRGQNSVDVIVPNTGAYFPGWWSYQKSVFVSTPPLVRISAPKEIISPGEVITLSAAESYDTEGQPLSYTWTVNGAVRANTPTYQFSSSVSGNYTISVQVSNGGNSINCSIAQKIVQVRVNTQPYAEISIPGVFGTDEQVIAAAVNAEDADNEQLDFNWQGVGLSELAVGNRVPVMHKTPGTYTIALLVNDQSGATNSSYSATQSYQVNAAPIVEFLMPEKAAPGQNFNVDGRPTRDPDDDNLFYTWLVDGREVASTVQTTLALAEPGNYTVTLRASDPKKVSNSTRELSKSLRVNAPPVPAISAVSKSNKSSIPFSGEQSVDPESLIKSYLWDFGDGNTATGATARNVYQKPGTYIVKLTVDDGEGLSNSVQTTEYTVVINANPISAISAPEVVAPGQPFRVDGTSSIDPDGKISGYKWFVNGKEIPGAAQAEITLKESGIHTISLEVKDDSGFEDARSISSRNIRVNKSPVPIWRMEADHFEPDTEIKFSAEDSYDPDGAIKTYEWTFDDQTVIRGKVVQRFFTEPGVRSFALKVIDEEGLSNSESSVNGSIKVNHQPFIVTQKEIVSNSLNINLSATESYDLDNDPIRFEWVLPDGSIRNEAAFSWTAPNTGVHIITLKTDDGLGLGNSTRFETIRVLINEPVKAVLEPEILSCTGQTVLFNSSNSFDPDGDPFSVKWSFGDGKTSNEANPVYIYNKVGFYEAVAELHDGISDKPTIGKIPVIIEGSPIAGINIADTTVCVNTRLLFDASSSSDPSGNQPSFSWDFGDGESKTGMRADYAFSKAGTYIVNLTVEGSGSGHCGNTGQTSAIVRVVEGPEAHFELPAELSPNQKIILDASGSTADGGIRDASWTIRPAAAGAAVSLSGVSASHSFSEPGLYDVTLTLSTNSTASCNTVSLTKQVRVNAPPVISLAIPDQVAIGADVRLDGTGSSDPDGVVVSYTWKLNGAEISTNASELIKFNTPGTQNIELIIRDNSSASNNTIRAERSVFVNRPPNPKIKEISQPVYHTQTIRFDAEAAKDADGDELSTIWKVNGNIVNEPTLYLAEPIPYSITLIQNDGRNLSNSADSVSLTVYPLAIKELNPVIPEHIIAGSTLSVTDLKLDKREVFFDRGGQQSETWAVPGEGTHSFILAWKPADEILAQKEFSLSALPILAFKESFQTVTTEWNPANPAVIISAPAINRADGEVTYTWKQNGRIVGYGKTIELKISRGLNEVTLEASEQGVIGSKIIRTTAIIEAN